MTPVARAANVNSTQHQLNPHTQSQNQVIQPSCTINLYDYVNVDEKILKKISMTEDPIPNYVIRPSYTAK